MSLVNNERAIENLYVIHKVEYRKNITLLHVVRYVTKWGPIHQLEKREYYRTGDGGLFSGKRLALKLEDIDIIIADYPKIRKFLTLPKDELLKIFPNEVREL